MANIMISGKATPAPNGGSGVRFPTFSITQRDAVY
jgi:hypothetical protein